MFSQSNIGDLRYQHDGSEGSADSFVLSVNDGAGSLLENQTVSLTITPVDDATSADSNVIVYEGGSTSDASPGAGKPVPGMAISFSDADDSTKQVEIRSLPTVGQLFFNGTQITTVPSASFPSTQLSLLSYTHDGSDGTGNQSFDIRFTDTDGGGTGAAAQFDHTVNISVIPVNDDPTLDSATHAATLAEGTTYTFTTSDLNTSDADNNTSQVVFSINTAPTQGVIRLNGDALAAGGQFSQQDVIDGRVTYEHQGLTGGADSFIFSVRDGAINILTDQTGAVRDGGGALVQTTFNLTITDDNAAPILQTNSSHSAGAGSTIIVGSDVLSASDGDDTNSNIIYTLASTPSLGALQLSGSTLGVGQTFTQADINAGRVTYAHSGGAVGADNFTFTLADDGGAAGQTSGGGALGTVTHTINSVTLPPSVATNPAEVDESGTVTLTGTNLNSSDLMSDGVTSTADSDLVYKVETLPAYGVVRLNGTVLGVGDTFTQADVNASNVTYLNNGSHQIAGASEDSFQFTVTDTENASTSGSLTIDIVSDPPVLQQNNTLTVAEASTETITAGFLSATDPDDANDQIIFSVTTTPQHGVLQLNGVTLDTGATFTQADIAAGLLTYTQQGSQVDVTGAALTGDSFQFTLADDLETPGKAIGGGADLGTGTFNIALTVNAGDDAPDSNFVYQKQYVKTGEQVTVASLSITDNDSIPADIIYTLVDAPDHGELRLNGSPTALSNGATFTQADINSGNLVYFHTSGGAVVDGFDFSIADDDGNAAMDGGSLLGTRTHVIEPSASTPPVVGGSASSTPITVAEDSVTTILQSQLEATDVDSAGSPTPPSQLVYELTTLPDHGSIELNNVALTIGQTFTQQDINDGLVRYVNTGPQNSATNTVTGFNYTLSDADGAEIAGTFGITITPVNDAPILATASTLYLQSGGSGVIGSSLLNTTDNDHAANQIGYTIDSLPTHGTLSVNGTPATIGTIFSQADINAGNLTFVHDGGATKNSSFSFSIVDQAGASGTNSGGAPLGSGTLAIVVDDASGAPSIAVNNTLDSFLEGSTVTITTANLSATDPDTSDPKQLVFTVTRAPADGTLRVDGTPVGPNGFFTQDDLINNRVTYVHNGSENFRDDFIFSLSDGGASAAVIGTFNFEIDPVNDQPDIDRSSVQLSEGGSVTFTTGMLDVSDEDGSAEISLAADAPLQIRVDTLPSFGELRYNGTLVDVTPSGFTFDHANIGLLTYQHNGNEDYSDAFNFTVIDNSTNAHTGSPNGEVTTRSGTMNFSIVPVPDDPAVAVNTGLLKANGKAVYEEGERQITIADLSSSDPDSSDEQVQFRILTATSHGKLVLRDGGTDTALGANSAFSQADVVAGKLYYIHAGEEQFTDTFQFQVDDAGGGNVAPQNFNIEVIEVNEAPVLVMPGETSVDEDTTLAIEAITFTDIDLNTDDANAEVRVTLSVANGVLNIGATAGLSFTLGKENGLAEVEFAGTLAEVTAALASISYTPGASYIGADTLNITLNDQGNFGVDPSTIGRAATGDGSSEEATGSISINVLPINDAPTIVVADAQAEINAQVYREDEGRTLEFGDIVFADVDAAGDDVEVTLSAANGVLELQNTTGVAVSGNGTASVTITGSISAINAILDGAGTGSGSNNVLYESNANYTGSDTITVAINDKGNNGFGGPKTTTATLTATVDPVNDAPVIGGPNSVTAYEGKPQALGITVADIDSDTSDIQVSLTLTNPSPAIASFGTLEFGSVPPGVSFTTGSASGDSAVVVEGTVAEIETLLNGLRYVADPDHEENFGVDLVINVNDQGNVGDDPSDLPGSHPLAGTGTGGVSDEQADKTVAISVLAVNDRPDFTSGLSFSTDEDSTLNFNLGGFTITDDDANKGSDIGWIQLDVNFGTLDLSSAAASQVASFGGTVAGGADQVRISGLTFDQIETVLSASNALVYEPNANYNNANPDLNDERLNVRFRDMGNTGVDPSAAGMANSGNGAYEERSRNFNLTVNAINDAPTVSGVPGTINSIKK
ncbi:MAG: cadherin-like domain-containing protein [Pseudomonadota bacterium]